MVESIFNSQIEEYSILENSCSCISAVRDKWKDVIMCVYEEVSAAFTLNDNPDTTWMVFLWY